MCVQRRATRRSRFNPRPLVLLMERDPARRRVLADGLRSIGCDTFSVSDSATVHKEVTGRRGLDLLVVDEAVLTDSCLRAMRERSPALGIITIGERGASDRDLPSPAVKLHHPVSLTALVRALHELLHERATAIADF